MTCKSHALLLVFAIVGIVPDTISPFHDASVATAAVVHGSALAASVHHDYRCGLGPFIAYAMGFGLLGIVLLVTLVLAAGRRSARIRSTQPEVISPAVAGAVLQRTARMHYGACGLGLVAMFIAFGVESYGSGLMLCILSMLVLSRGTCCTLALRWLGEGATVERRANALIARTTSDSMTIHSARWIFDDAQRALVPTATARIR